MKKTFAGFIAILVFSLACSCVSTPTPKEESLPDTAASGASEDAATPVAEQSQDSAQAEQSESVTEKPSEPENPPGVPLGEKFLQYYPEPETLVMIADPAEKPPTDKPQKTEDTKTKPRVEKKPEAPMTDNKKPVVPTPESKPDDKAASEVLPGIWENEPVAPSVPPVATKPTVVPSRKTTLSVGQTLEVWYPATGWVYLGDASAQNGLGYQTRKMDKNDTLFTFKALKEGNYILDFSRYDVLSDGFTADSIAVSVTASGTGRQDKVRAPDYREADLPVSLQGFETTSAIPQSVAVDEPMLQSVQTISEATDQSAVHSDELIVKARAALASGDSASALALLDAFFGVAVTSLDEGWFLRGQAFEANTASRDMKKALQAYETLSAAYPDSVRWKEADARIRYIRQFYLRIR